jgi:hypothetical protein
MVAGKEKTGGDYMQYSGKHYPGKVENLPERP